jgi:hypothetical protein
MDLSHSSSLTNMSFNQLKKIEKNDSNQKYSKNFQKSNEILRDTTRNSYYNKYLEECNRAKLNSNKKTSSFRQNKLKNEKDVNPYNKSHNLSLIYQKKSKNLSMDKNILMMTNNIDKNYSSSYIDKKKVKRLTVDKISNSENTNINIPINNNSTLSDNDNTSINLLLKAKERSRKLIEKNDNAKNSNIFPRNIPQIKNLSYRENAYLILSYSDALRLRERLIFSRSSINLRKNISKKQILETNKIYLTEKLKELQNNLNICNEKLKSKFTVSKTAEMIFNFITSYIENDFKLNTPQILNDKHEKNQYYNYIKLLYILLDESYDNISNEDLTNQLYQKINNKGFNNIKDYLYFIYIKNLKENKVIENAEIIQKLIKEIPDFINYQKSIKYSKFISYCCYLIKEIVNFIEEKMNSLILKKNYINLIEIVNNKLNNYNDKKYINMKNNISNKNDIHGFI